MRATGQQRRPGAIAETTPIGVIPAPEAARRAAVKPIRRAKKNFLSILDLDPAELEQCLDLAARLKRERHLGPKSANGEALAGLHVALVFEKPSLRTRATFEIAVRELGGHVIEPRNEVSFGSRESTADVARNLERWVSAVVYRTFEQARLVEFAEAVPRLPVINALTNEEHPCQALADYLTLQERWGTLEGRTVAFIGDGNNVATSLAHAGTMLGVSLHVASPPGYALPSSVVDAATRVARKGGQIRQFSDPFDAIATASAVYTDTWISMGQEIEADERRRIFTPYQINAELMRRAPEGALFMHCLPAHRGEEVTDEVIDSATSVVFDQAENRLHAQKALLLMLLGR